MACKDELYDPAVNYDSGSDDEDFEPNNNNANLSSSPRSCGNNCINDVFIRSNLRSGGPMMNKDGTACKPSEVDGKTKPQKEGDGSDLKGAQGGETEAPPAEGKQVEECWGKETEEEKERARAQGGKLCDNLTVDRKCHHPTRGFVGFHYNGCQCDCKYKYCYVCAKLSPCPRNPNHLLDLKNEPQRLPLDPSPKS